MTYPLPTEEQEHPVSSPSPVLLTAALTGLMGAGLVSCSTDKSSDDGPPQPPLAGALTEEGDESMNPQPEDNSLIISEVEVPDFSYEVWAEECETHASCGGTNSCKGWSFNMYNSKLMEHNCRGVNSCGGMSCVVLPADTGRSGEEVFKAECAGCHQHGATEEDFLVHVPPGGDSKAAIAAFPAFSVTGHEMIVAFGTQGLGKDGRYYSNMPWYYEKLSRPEIGKVVTYLRALNPVPYEYAIMGPGWTKEDVPE